MTDSPSRRILITGGAGFIGHHVVDYYLQSTDYDLVLLDRLDTSGNLNRIKDLSSFDPERVTFVWHDLKAAINEQVANKIGKVDDVIHLAAASHVDRSISDPMSFVMDNVVGTTNLLIWAKDGGMNKEILVDHPLSSRAIGVKYTGKFINFSTDEVFGPAAPGHNHKENEQHLPSNPYAGSKSGQVAMGYSFWITYKLPVINTYTMNNFGERQHPEKLVPKALRAIINGDEMPIFAELKDGELQAVGSRFWLHAWDTADAIEYILRNGVVGESYNVAGTEELSNLEVCEAVAQALNDYCAWADVKSDYKLKPKFIDFHATRPGHDRRYALDGAKLAALGWKPSYTFKEAMYRVVQFTINNPHWQ